MYSPRPFGRLLGKLDTSGREIIEKSEGGLEWWKGPHSEAQPCFRRERALVRDRLAAARGGLAWGQGTGDSEDAGEAALPEIRTLSGTWRSLLEDEPGEAVP